MSLISNVSFLYDSDHDEKEKDATPQAVLTALSSVIVSKEEITVAGVLSIMAAFSLLSAAVLIYRKCSSARVRVHAASESPYRSPLPPIHCISRNRW